MSDIHQFLDKDYEQQEFNDLAEAPVDAIQGLSQSDADALKQALGVRTVRDLAENKFVRIAQALVALATVGPGAAREVSVKAVAESSERRVPGSAAGRVLIRDDFDAPLPDDLLASFSGKRDF